MGHLDRLVPTLQSPEREDRPEIQRLRACSTVGFSGTMRTELVLWCLLHYGIPNIPDALVLDPIAGTGTTAIATWLAEIRAFFGMEGDAGTYQLAQATMKKLGIRGGFAFGDASVTSALEAFGCEVPPKSWNGCLFLSPPFPNCHTQGKTENQKSLQKLKGTYGGNDMGFSDVWGCGATPKREKWTAYLGKLLANWIKYFSSGSLLFIHVKDYVREKKIVDVGQWVVDAIEQANRSSEEASVVPIGFHEVELGYGLSFNEWKKYVPRNVIEVLGPDSVRLECHHVKVYSKTPGQIPSWSGCKECGERPDAVSVNSEKIVVGKIL